MSAVPSAPPPSYEAVADNQNQGAPYPAQPNPGYPATGAGYGAPQGQSYNNQPQQPTNTSGYQHNPGYQQVLGGQTRFDGTVHHHFN